MYYGVKNFAKLAFYDLETNKLAAYFPFGNSFGISITGDSVEATANGATIITWQANRKGTMSLDSQTMSPKLLTIILGATYSKEATGTIVQYETGKIDSTTGKFSIKNKPESATLSVFLVKGDGATIIKELEASVAAPTADQYSISDKEITVHADNKGANILCIYAKAGTDIEKVVIKSSEFSKPYRVVGLGVVRGVDKIDRLQEIDIKSATSQSNIDFTYSATEASSFSMTFDLAADPVTDEMVIFKTL